MKETILIDVICYVLLFIFGSIVCKFFIVSFDNNPTKKYLLFGLLFDLIFYKYKLSYTTIKYLIIIIVMLKISINDLLFYTIPNRYLLIGLLNNIFFSLLENFNIKFLLISFLNGLLISLSILLLSMMMSIICKKEMLGGGDIKLLFVLGTYFAINQNVFALLVASIIALIYIIINKRKGQIPFGPFICIGYLLIIL